MTDALAGPYHRGPAGTTVLRSFMRGCRKRYTKYVQASYIYLVEINYVDNDGNMHYFSEFKQRLREIGIKSCEIIFLTSESFQNK